MRSTLVPLTVAALTLAGCSKKPAPEVVPTPTEQPRPTPPNPTPDTNRPPVNTTDPATCQNAITSGVTELSRMVNFDTDMYDVRPADMGTLDAKADVLKMFPLVRLRVAGHADERYTDEYNLVLGTRRAESVRDYLVRKGIEGTRLETASLGETAPFDPAHTEAAWDKNRRAEFTLLSGRESLSSRIPGCT
jgi:peptidoglycan-associated lipoprotein